MRPAILFVICLMLSCTEPVEVEFGSDQNYFVIDGFITNECGPHMISISQTVAFANDDASLLPQKVAGAIVSLSDDLGNMENLIESERGIYETSSTYQGIPGRTYVLEVQIGDDLFVSTPQTLHLPAKIDTIYFEREVVETITGFGNIEEKERIDFYSDVTFNSENSFGALSWNGTFQWVAILNPDSQPFNCYVNEQDVGFSNLLDAGLFGDVQKKVLVEKLNNSDRFVERYSFNALLYTFGKEAYDYSNQVDEQINSTGSVFDPLPFQIIGNMRDVRDDTRTVLGFFGAYGIDSRRRSFSHHELGVAIVNCWLPWVPPPSKNIPACEDCRLYPGAYTTEPPYWRD